MMEAKKYFNTRKNMMEEVQYLCQYNILLSHTLRFKSLTPPPPITTAAATATD